MDTRKKEILTAPFPYFGGKSKVAPVVWERLGNVGTYVEPFGGSLAVLLARPDSHEWWAKKEAAGDSNGFVVNFYRAVKKNPDAVAELASAPVNEADLTARHLVLVRQEESLTQELSSDPHYFNVELAAWWVWGISAWVGGEWCSGLGPWKPGDPNGPGVFRKMPMITGNHGGKGIHKPVKDVPRKIDNDYYNVEGMYQEHLKLMFRRITNRLHRVRLIHGDWKRLTRSATQPHTNDYTGIFLDPPYDPSLRRGDLYGGSDTKPLRVPVHEEVREWALEKGENKQMKIAYCAYDAQEEHALFEAAGWQSYHWTAAGGYGLQADNAAKTNREKEIIWFSPACVG